MKHLINNIGWIGLILTILSLSITSCKKDTQTKPNPTPTPQSIIHYKRIATVLFQYDEVADIYVYGTTMSGPATNLLNDTVSYPNFHYTPKSTPLIIHGSVNISSNNDTLYLTYSNYNPWVNQTNYVTNAKYLKQ